MGHSGAFHARGAAVYQIVSANYRAVIRQRGDYSALCSCIMGRSYADICVYVQHDVIRSIHNGMHNCPQLLSVAVEVLSMTFWYMLYISQRNYCWMKYIYYCFILFHFVTFIHLLFFWRCVCVWGGGLGGGGGGGGIYHASYQYAYYHL